MAGLHLWAWDSGACCCVLQGVGQKEIELREPLVAM